jgi:iron complex outermembrane receptor protein
LHAGYDLLRESIHPKPGRTDATGGLNETADPEQQFFLRSSVDLPHRVEVDAALRWVDSFSINSGPTSGPVAATVPSYFELDARIGWWITKQFELSVVGRNLLHDHHPEYGYPDPTRQEMTRSVYGKAAWHF